MNSKKFMYGALINFNKRSLDIDNTKTYGWVSFNVFLKNKNSQFYIGLNSYEDGQKLIASSELNFKHNSFNSKLNAGRFLKPSHISFIDIILFEQKDHFWVENNLILNKSKIGKGVNKLETLNKEAKILFKEGKVDNPSYVSLSSVQKKKIRDKLRK